VIEDVTHLKVVNGRGQAMALLSQCGSTPCPFKPGDWNSPCQELCSNRRKFLFRVIGVSAEANVKRYKPGKVHGACSSLFNQDKWLAHRCDERVVPIQKEEYTILLLGMKHLWRKRQSAR
jgi:hypothetical protein